MKPITFTLDHPPLSVLDELIARHGRLKVLWALLSATRRPAVNRRIVSDDDLSEHLRRDIGLRPQSSTPKYWEVR